VKRTVAASVACLALVTAGCSKSPASPGVAQLTSTAPTVASGSAAASSAPANGHTLLAYSQCMRAHGVPDFPDPVGDELHIDARSPNSDLNPDSPQYATAEKACKALEPTRHAGAISAKDQADALKYSACMRSHGLPNFADPVFTNGGIQQRVDGDPNSAPFKAADKACHQFQPGPGRTTKQSSGGATTDSAS
jgi:hypothetical protein